MIVSFLDLPFLSVIMRPTEILSQTTTYLQQRIHSYYANWQLFWTHIVIDKFSITITAPLVRLLAH